jgi:hypothetical protein
MASPFALLLLEASRLGAATMSFEVDLVDYEPASLHFRWLARVQTTDSRVFSATGRSGEGALRKILEILVHMSQ